jgi:hypothetical protein
MQKLLVNNTMLQTQLYKKLFTIYLWITKIADKLCSWYQQTKAHYLFISRNKNKYVVLKN